MSGNSDDVFERNVENLVRKGALPLRGGRAARAREAFLSRLSAPPADVSRSRKGRWVAMAASVLTGGIVIWALVSGGEGEKAAPAPPEPKPPARQAAEEPRAPEPGASRRVATAPEQEARVVARPTPEASSFPAYRVTGSVPLPDRSAVSVRIRRLRETYTAGRLVRSERLWLSQLEQVREGRFEAETRMPSGAYVAVVTPYEDAPSGRTWTFAVNAWGERLPDRIREELEEVQQLHRRVLAVVRDFEDACTSRAAWEAVARKLTAEGRRVERAIAARTRTSFCSASVHEMHFTMRDVLGAAKSFKWADGEFRPRSYHGEVKTHRDEKFAYATLRRYLEEVEPLARREALLWSVRDARRSGAVDPAFHPLLDRVSADPFLAPLAARLREEKPDLDAIEEALREGPATRER